MLGYFAEFMDKYMKQDNNSQYHKSNLCDDFKHYIKTNYNITIGGSRSKEDVLYKMVTGCYGEPTIVQKTHQQMWWNVKCSYNRK